MVVHVSRGQFLFQKRHIFYFQRRIPKRVQSHYPRSKIVLSLRTANRSIAKRRAQEIARNLDEFWFGLGFKAAGIPVREFFPSSPVNPSSKLSLGGLMDSYLTGRNAGKPLTFKSAVTRGFGYFKSTCGDRNLDDYTRQDAIQFRDALLKRGLAPQSVSRIISTLRGATNFAINELGLEIKNIFTNINVGAKEARRERHSFTRRELDHIAQMCSEANDSKRWLIALLSDSGMRLAEAAGLLISDLNVDAEIPHIDLKAHPWRPLKTSSSARKVPLVGRSLWAAKEIVKQGGTFAFPGYCDEMTCNANSASATLNKWLKSIGMGPGKVIHSFRHTFRDRLRAVECPSDIVDQLGGWTTVGVGHGYGSGYPLKVLEKWAGQAMLQKPISVLNQD